MNPIRPHIIVLGLIPLLCGCGHLLPEIVPFGAVRGVDGNRSLNGLGIHRKMWESVGAKCLTPQKLSPKLETMDTIVLVGQSYDPPGKAAREWLEQWLGNESGRTVIYFGRDFNANVYYRQQTLGQLARDKQSRGEHELARARVSELNARLRQLPESTFCRWFYLDTSLPRKEYTQFSGTWATDLANASGAWPVGVALQPPQRKWRKKTPSWLKKSGPKIVKQDKQAETESDKPVVRRSDWEPEELDTIEVWQSEFRSLAKFETLLSGDDGQPLVFRLSDQSFEGSQILVVANGAPLLNGSLVEPLHRLIGEKLIAECLPAERVALLAYGEKGLLITPVAESDSRAAGLEMLTVWPLSAITMPAALLGILVCAVLFPILGRPQRLRQRSVSDFGLHIEAMGRMLLDSRDITYAKKMVGDYFRQVRRDSPPDWLDSIGPEEAPKTTPITSTQVQSADTKTQQGP